jgi:AcrR family transcriptional regulator
MYNDFLIIRGSQVIDSQRIKRQEEIENAAYELLRDKGYKASSMLAIAKYAGASNETLYKWYGNKQELFVCLVKRNVAEIKDRLERQVGDNSSPLQELCKISRELLSALMSEKAITLNRAAATDVYENNQLGKAIAQNGRETIAPLLSKLLLLANDQRELSFTDVKEITETYLSLLIGDWQIRRVIDVMQAPSKKEITARANRTIDLLVQLYPVDQRNGPFSK